VGDKSEVAQLPVVCGRVALVVVLSKRDCSITIWVWTGHGCRIEKVGKKELVSALSNKETAIIKKKGGVGGIEWN